MSCSCCVSGLDITHTDRYSRCVYCSLVILALASLVAYAQNTDNPLAGDPKSADGGGAVFRPYCVPCHGVYGKGGRGPDLTLGLYAAGEKDSDLFRVIANGVPGTEMAGFGSDIREEDIWRVVSYIRSIARRDAAGVAGDRPNGEKLFWGKGGCGACHAVGRRGGHMGPDLTRVGELRSRAYLRESVLEPSKDISPGYAAITVVKRDGTKLTGVERGFDDFSAQLIDASGNYYSILRSDVRSATRELRSLMPDNYSRLFNSVEVDDLLAYLVSLRHVEATR
jgi:putative heme-binding domain-containing protein